MLSSYISQSMTWLVCLSIESKLMIREEYESLADFPLANATVLEGVHTK